jgi:hypothetical protein
MSEFEKFIHPADALKLLDQVSVVDPRNKHIGLADWYERIEKITLVETTPKEVKQLFENAKNIALYTYFAYRLHQSAEIIGYSALEKALKMKFEQEKNFVKVQRTPSSLADYMNTALEQQWITNQGYESFRNLAETRLLDKKVNELIESGALDNGEGMPVPEPEDHELIAEMESMDIAKDTLHSGRRIRNSLAHGVGGLMPSSIGTLSKISEEINQLFKIYNGGVE